jgi:hypothetical protein
VPGRVHGFPHLLEQRFRFLELALVGEDLAHVVLRACDVDDVTHAAAQLAAAPVELGGLVPEAREVGLDPEVVDEVRLQRVRPDVTRKGRKVATLTDGDFFGQIDPS